MPRLYVNLMPFYIRELSVPRFWHGGGGSEGIVEPTPQGCWGWLYSDKIDDADGKDHNIPHHDNFLKHFFKTRLLWENQPVTFKKVDFGEQEKSALDDKMWSQKWNKASHSSRKDGSQRSDTVSTTDEHSWVTGSPCSLPHGTIKRSARFN